MSLSALRVLASGVALTIVLFSPPSARAASPVGLEVYGSLPKTEEVELSPDGEMFAAIETQGDTRVVAVKGVDGHVITQGVVGDLKLAGLAWAGNDYLIVYLRQTASLSFSRRLEQEFLQGVVLSIKDGKTRPLLPTSPEYLPAIFGRYGLAQQDGHWFGYFGLVPTEASKDPTQTAGFFKQRYPDLYRVDIGTGEVRLVTRGNSASRSWVVDSNGQIVAEADSNADSGAWQVFLPNAQSQPLASGNSPFGFSLYGQGRTPRTVLLRKGGTGGDIAELHLNDGKLENLLPTAKAMTRIYSRSTHLLLGAVLIDDGDVVMFDPTLDRRVHSIAKAFAGDRVRLISVSDDLSKVLVHISGKDTAGTWQLVDFKTGKAAPIAEQYPTIPDAMIANSQMIDYRANDGLQLQGVLTLPAHADAHNLPLIVLPHGGPDERDRADFDWRAQAFSSLGYAVFQPNFRGSGGYGMSFLSAGFGEWGRKMQTDISDGVATLTAKGIVDPKRVCIVGTSAYGGYAALAGVTLQHGLYRCAASFGAISDIRDLIYSRKQHDRGDTRHYAAPGNRFWLSYVGSQSPDDAILDTISPQVQAKAADAPVLLIHAQHDSFVLPSQSSDMASALKSAGKSVELIELEGEDHWLSRSETRLQMLKAVVAFVEKYNPPDTQATH